MFFPDTQACNEPNSETPMDPSAITSQDAFISAVGQRFVNGDAVLSGLMSALGGNALDSYQGNAGVPTTGAGGFPWFPGPSVPNPFPVSDSGSPGAAGGWQPGGRRRPITAASFVCTPPVVLPWVTVLRIPPIQPASAPVPPPAAPKPAPVVIPVPAAPPPPKANCSTGNICLDIRNGCVLSSQVSPQQLYACSAAGYQGNANLYGSTGGLFLGSPDLSPGAFDPSMLSNHPGISGLGDDGSSTSRLFAAGLGLVALVWMASKMKKGR